LIVSSIFFFLSVFQINCETVLTPFGYRRAECVHQAKNGHRLRPTSVGVEVVENSSGRVIEFHPKLDVCEEEAEEIRKNLLNKREGVSATNGWLDYVSYTPTFNVADFYGQYTVPANPKISLNQVLFYFIGVENLKQSPVTILQPVLTWGNGHTGWNMASWNCCPSGQTWTSDFILNLQTGQVLNGYINVTTSTSTIVSELVGGSSVTLEIDTNSRNFDWMDVTLEVYSVSTCGQFSQGSMTISDMSAHDVRGNKLSPNWADATGSTLCSGKQTFTSTTWQDYHSA
jgi:hypothetical protein